MGPRKSFNNSKNKLISRNRIEYLISVVVKGMQLTLINAQSPHTIKS
jgi:hypothetical protein